MHLTIDKSSNILDRRKYHVVEHYDTKLEERKMNVKTWYGGAVVLL